MSAEIIGSAAEITVTTERVVRLVSTSPVATVAATDHFPRILTGMVYQMRRVVYQYHSLPVPEVDEYDEGVTREQHPPHREIRGRRTALALSRGTRPPS
jgi:hypothetical protein